MKKLILLLVSAAIFTFSSAFAWEGAEEYEQRKQFSLSHELDVYTEASTDKAPYYGARLEPRTGVYFGTLAENCDEFSNISTCLTYIEFDEMQPDFYYPANDMIKRKNVNVMVGWNVSSANTIKNIDSYTDYIEKTVKRMASYGKNVYIRFAGEMNDKNLGSGEEYKYAFRKVADIAHRYDNLAMVWSPIALGSLIKPFADYYPGDEYVDWIGLSSYQVRYWGGNSNASIDDQRVFMVGNYAWQTNSMKPMFKFISDYGINKPVMITEGGVATGNSKGEDTSDWASQRLQNMYWDLIMKYPQVKMINYFNAKMNENEYFNLDSHSDLISIIKNATEHGAYICSNAGNTFSFAELSGSGTLVGPQIPIYSHAYACDAEFIKVDYYVDGTLYDSNVYIPHDTTLNLSGLSDGQHKLEVCSFNGSELLDVKEFTFTKLGAFVRFGNGSIVNNKTINISLNGQQIIFDTQPCVIADTTLVPIRAFANALGISDSDIDYNGSENTVTIKNGSDTVKLYINNPTAYVNGSSTKIEVPPTIIDGRTLVPLRFISENFKCSVDFSDSDSVLNIFLASK